MFTFSSIRPKAAVLGVRFVRHVVKKELPVPGFEKRLDVVILGTPNVGKSVLLNQLVSSKIAATSRKQHTTRNEILGVFNHRNIQLAFYDTPGYVRQAEALQATSIELNKTTTKAIKKADVVLLVVDSAYCSDIRYHDAFCEMVKMGLDNAKKEIILVLNKVDLITPKERLLDITRMMVSLINGVKLGPGRENEAKLDTTTFMVSALENDGLIDIKNYLLAISEVKPWTLTERDGVSGVAIQTRIEEMVLEQLLNYTHEEIPYIATIECTTIKKASRDGQRLLVEVTIWVDTPGQQRIVVGQHGRTLVKIRQSAVDDLEVILKKEVILKLWIKLRKGKEIVKKGNEEFNSDGESATDDDSDSDDDGDSD